MEYIEREALINTCKKIIQERWNETTAPVSWSHAYADFIDDINNQPTADVAPVKHGKWNVGYFHDRVCSVCTHPDSSLNVFPHKYCPNCGAKMDDEIRKD